MRVLVLGGNGFIGSHLIDALIKATFRVRVFDHQQERYRQPLPGVDYRFGDFTDRSAVDDALRDIDLVFHLIGTTLPQSSNQDPGFDVSSNVLPTIRLLQDCVRHRVRKLVFVSSGGTVYGTPSACPVSEDSPTHPECSYGITKLTIEKYLDLFRREHGLDYCILRPANPYGPRQNLKGSQGAVTVFLTKVAAGSPITVWGDGEVVRDYLFVGDLVAAIFAAATTETESRVFNVGSGAGHSLNEVIQSIFRITGRTIDVRYAPKRTFDVREIYLDTTRARTELGWKPTVAFDDGILMTWQFVQAAARGAPKRTRTASTSLAPAP